MNAANFCGAPWQKELGPMVDFSNRITPSNAKEIKGVIPPKCFLQSLVQCLKVMIMGVFNCAIYLIEYN